jgi:hypothetical protein
MTETRMPGTEINDLRIRITSALTTTFDILGWLNYDEDDGLERIVEAVIAELELHPEHDEEIMRDNQGRVTKLRNRIRWATSWKTDYSTVYTRKNQ